MRFHKTTLNLLAVDFQSVAQDILSDYCTDLVKVYGMYHEDLPPKDAERLVLYYTLRTILKVQDVLDDKKNIVFYVDDTICPDRLTVLIAKSLKKIEKSFPVLVYHGTIDFNEITVKSGESNELINSISEYRYSYDFSKRPPRVATKFIEKYKLKIGSENPGDI